MEEDKIISALIGLVGACNNNSKTENTDNVLIKALAVSVLCKESNDESLSGIIDEIYLEKNAVAPNCAGCASPCGNTSDYDMSRMYEVEPEIRNIKLKLLSKCQNLAAYAYRSREQKEKVQLDCVLFYKILSCISYDTGKEQLLEYLGEVEAKEQEIGLGG